MADSLKWARKVSAAFANGMKETIATLRQLSDTLSNLPDTGVPGTLKRDAGPRLEDVADVLGKEEFFEGGPMLGATKQALEQLVAKAVTDLASEQNNLCLAEIEKWQRSSDWLDLDPEDRDNVTASASALSITSPQTLSGFQQLLAHAFDVHNGLREIEKSVATTADQRRLERGAVSPPSGGQEGETIEQIIAVPPMLTTVDQIDSLLQQLQHLRVRLASGESLQIVWKQVDTDVV